MRRIGFTATRDQLTFEQATALRFWMEARTAEFHHGDCIGGDEAAHWIARSLRGWRIVVHPGDTPDLRAFVSGYDVLCPEKPNLERNSDIVNETDELLAAPRGPEVTRSGTWSTIRKARRAGKAVTIIWPDGMVEVESANPAEHSAPLAAAEQRASAPPATADQNPHPPILAREDHK